MRHHMAVVVLGIWACLAAPAWAENQQRQVTLRNTYYVVLLESSYTKYTIDSELRTMDGTVLARVSHQFKKAADIEGTARLLDGRIVNYAGRVDGEIRWFVSDSRFGYGVGKCKLVPFHTIAVDPDIVPLGSVVSIAETEGMALPDGSRHDGIWRAEDIGAAIKKDRVDLFIGDSDNEGIIEHNGISNLQPLHVTILQDPAPDSCVTQTREP